MILCGHSSYPRDLDYAAFKAIADEVGALAMADISHIGGLVAAGVLQNPFDSGFDVVTTTTHKTLRGPRGGMILCKSAYAKTIDASVFPGLQGGPHMNNVAAKAYALKKAGTESFRRYAQSVRTNARILAQGLVENGAKLVTGGTENHLIVLETKTTFGVDGHDAQRAFDQVGLVVNKQIIPDDPLPPARPSGIRVGTPAVTTRGMTADMMKTFANWIVSTLRSAARSDTQALDTLASEVRRLAIAYPIPGLGHRAIS
jgi:glycine hydroxymethyltransferase